MRGRVARPTYRRSGEADVVPTYQLAAVIREFSRRWLLERPNCDDDFFMGPVDYLSYHTDVPHRMISRITAEEFVTTPLSRAELLLMAMDHEYMLATGEIQVVPNPNWSLESWLAYQEERGCC